MKTATIHHLRWCPFPPNEVCEIAHHVKKGKIKKEEKEWVAIVYENNIT